MSQEQIDCLYQAVQALNADQSDLTWCVTGKPSFATTDKYGIASNLSLSTNSLEYKQVLRARLNVDEIAFKLSHNLKGLDTTYLIRLFWSLAFFRLYSTDLIAAIESRVQENISSGTRLSDSEMVKLLWADAMLLQNKSVLDISLSNLSHFEIPDLLNIFFSVTVVGNNFDLIKSVRETLFSKISRTSTNVPSDFIVRYNRLVHCSVAVLNEEDGRNFLVKLKSKAKQRQPYNYTFQLCLASHGTLRPKRLEVNPVVESVFPFDVAYSTSRRKILLEITRPDSLIREIGTFQVVGVDGYTRLTRLALSRMSYHIVNFSVTEWTNAGDMEKKMDLVRRRVRNCIKGKRLFTGTERDTLENDDSGADGYSDDSDMSY